MILVNGSEAAEILGITSEGIRYLVNKGELKAHRTISHGRIKLYLKTEVHALHARRLKEMKAKQKEVAELLGPPSRGG